MLISQNNARVERVFDRVYERKIKGEETNFFSLVAQGKQTVVVPTGLQYSDGCITVQTPLGDFRVAVTVREGYFTFELLEALPAAAYMGAMAHVKYTYDVKDKSSTGAIGIAMTYWTNPCFYPDAKALETKAEALTSLRPEGAKFALIIAPIAEHKELIKKVCLTMIQRKASSASMAKGFQTQLRKLHAGA